jgi:hypothetical protein
MEGTGLMLTTWSLLPLSGLRTDGNAVQGCDTGSSDISDIMLDETMDAAMDGFGELNANTHVSVKACLVYRWYLIYTVISLFSTCFALLEASAD